MHPQDDSAFRFRIREPRVKTVNFDVSKNRPKLIDYHSNVPWTTRSATDDVARQHRIRLKSLYSSRKRSDKA